MFLWSLFVVVSFCLVDQPHKPSEIIKYLLDTFDFDVNETFEHDNLTLFQIAAKNSKVDIDIFLNYNNGINKNSDSNDDKINKKINVYLPAQDTLSCFMINVPQQANGKERSHSLYNRCGWQNKESIESFVKYQQKVENIQIESLADFAYYGDIAKFKQQLYTIINLKHKINNWDELEASNILSNENINKWRKYASMRQNETIVGFLENLRTTALELKSFTLLQSVIEDGAINNVNIQGSNRRLNNNSIETEIEARLVAKQAKYLLKHCDDDTLANLSNVINNAILKQECGFDDSLLFVSKLYDNDKFINVLQECTSSCLSNDRKDKKKYLYFKHNLLHSKIWGTLDTTSDEVKTEKNDDDKFLFERIRLNVIEKELETQRNFIKNEIHKEEKEMKEWWNKLVKSNSKFLNVKSNPSQLKQPLQPDFEQNELPFDNVNGFDGSLEYDMNGYLTKLLIATHQIDPIFQKDCRNVFEREFQDFNCQITACAPPKTKGRCQTKAQLDYNTNDGYEWPTTRNIIDLIRTSVVFENSKDLLDGVAIFSKCVENKKAGCIKAILRCKNGFKDFNFENNGKNKNDLSVYDYRDVKLNVLIKYNRSKSLVGEIQFLLKFALMAKKLGHSIYRYDVSNSNRTLNTIFYFNTVFVALHYIYKKKFIAL